MTDPASSDRGVPAAEDDHRVILRLLGALEEAETPARIGPILQDLRELLPDHFRREEGPGGLYEELVTQNPGFGTEIRRLSSDHQALHAELVGLMELVSEIARVHAALAAAKGAFIKHLMAHEAKEGTLIVDAWNMDLGGSG